MLNFYSKKERKRQKIVQIDRNIITLSYVTVVILNAVNIRLLYVYLTWLFYMVYLNGYS